MITKDGGLVETTSISYHHYVMPPLKLVNDEEIISSNGRSSSLSDGSPPRIIVSDLTASWTHVSMLSCVCVCYWSVYRTGRSWY